MSQNTPHHLVRLFVPLVVKDLLLVTPNSLQHQIFNVSPSLSANLCRAFSDLIRTKPFQTQTRLTPSS